MSSKGKQTAVPKPRVRPAAKVPPPAPPPARVSEDSEPEEALAKQIRPPPLPAPAVKGKAAGGAKAPRQRKSAAMTKAEKAAIAASTAFRSFPKPRPSQLPPQPAASGATSVISKPPLPASSQPVSGTKRERVTEPSAVGEAAHSALQPRPKRQKVAPTPALPKPEKAKEPFSLALPTGSEFSLPSSVSAPSALFVGPSSNTVPTPSPLHEPVAPAADDSEEEDWDEVQPSASASTPTLPTPQQPVRAIQMEVIIPTASPRPDPMDNVDGSDGLPAGDEDFLQDMFDEAAEDDAPEDDFLQDALEETFEVRAPPKSMAELAQAELGADLGEDPLWPDDDEDDTSDDSSDDD